MRLSPARPSSGSRPAPRPRSGNPGGGRREAQRAHRAEEFPAVYFPITVHLLKLLDVFHDSCPPGDVRRVVMDSDVLAWSGETPFVPSTNPAELEFEERDCQGSCRASASANARTRGHRPGTCCTNRRHSDGPHRSAHAITSRNSGQMRRRLTGADSRIEPPWKTRQSAVAASADAAPGIRLQIDDRAHERFVPGGHARAAADRAGDHHTGDAQQAGQASTHANSGHS